MSIRSGASLTIGTSRVLSGLLLALLASCSDSTVPVHTPEPSPPAPAPVFPGLTRPGVIYVGDEGLYDVFVATHGSLASRFVLYTDSTFELQFSSMKRGYFAYTGRFARADSTVTFSWDGWSSAGPWGATGTLRGDSLRVEYNQVMMMTDFIDGVYVRTPAP